MLLSSLHEQGKASFHLLKLPGPINPIVATKIQVQAVKMTTLQIAQQPQESTPSVPWLINYLFLVLQTVSFKNWKLSNAVNENRFTGFQWQWMYCGHKFLIKYSRKTLRSAVSKLGHMQENPLGNKKKAFFFLKKTFNKN